MFLSNFNYFVMKRPENVIKSDIMTVNLTYIYFLKCRRKMTEDQVPVFLTGKSGAAVQ